METQRAWGEFPFCFECKTPALETLSSMIESNIDTSDDDTIDYGNGEGNDNGFISLVNEVLAENHSTFSTKVEQLMKENN